MFRQIAQILARNFFFPGILILSGTIQGYGQLCNGSLGDPVINITFGSGSGTGGYAPPSAYTYTASSCPDDGYYTITNRTSGCFGNSWHTVNNDHTGNGNFFLVNASFTPGDFFVSTVTDLCPNTTYEFAAWVMNVMNRSGIRPNLTFRIESTSGIILQSFSTGDIPETGGPQWVQYGFYFTTPLANAAIVLRITNNAPGGNGNDLALDDITFRPCGPTITSSVIGYSDTIDVCEGETRNYSFTSDISSAYVAPVYQWQSSNDSGKTWRDIPGATSINYQVGPVNPGAYWYRLAVTELSSAGIKACRIASDTIIINVRPKPLVNAGPDRVMFMGDSIKMAATVTGDDPVYRWSPGNFLSDPASLSAIARPPNEITYSLDALSSFGCTRSDAMTIKVVAGIFVPTAFTPNNDGLNDRWRIPFLDPSLGARVQVYNRFGEMVYAVSNDWVNWDGRHKGQPQPTGSFVYFIQMRTGVVLKGSFLLIR